MESSGPSRPPEAETNQNVGDRSAGQRISNEEDNGTRVGLNQRWLHPDSAEQYAMQIQLMQQAYFNYMVQYMQT